MRKIRDVPRLTAAGIPLRRLYSRLRRTFSDRFSTYDFAPMTEKSQRRISVEETPLSR
jgi:hypothetical protein